MKADCCLTSDETSCCDSREDANCVEESWHVCFHCSTQRDIFELCIARDGVNILFSGA